VSQTSFVKALHLLQLNVGLPAKRQEADDNAIQLPENTIREMK